MTSLDLRDYQKECIETVVAKARKGVTKQVIVLATGLGKTVIMSQFPGMVKAKGKKTLLLAHREELLTQAKDKFLWADSSLNIGIEKGEQALDAQMISECDVVVASVQTLGRSNSSRIEKFEPKDFGMILIDECHHATSSSYVNILKYFGGMKGEPNERKDIVVLGVTATPNRSDKTGLGEVFQEITFTYPLRKGIENGYLCNIKAFSVETGTDISYVHTSMGDLDEGELAEAVDTEERNKLIVDTYLEVAGGEKALAFAVNVEHAENLTRYFQSRGIPTACVLGSTDSDIRKETLSKFKSGEILVIVNVGVLTEGFDEPSIQALLMARPTKSSVLFAQMIGRGTRLHPGKDFLKLIDFVDNTGKNDLMSLPALLGVTAKKLKPTKKPRTITEMMPAIEKITDLDPNYPLDAIEDWSDENIEKIIKEIDIFAQAKLPPEVEANSSNTWEKFGEDAYRIKFPAEDSQKYAGKKMYQELKAIPNMLNQYEIHLETYVEQKPSFQNSFKKWALASDEIVQKTPNMEAAFKEGDSWIASNKPEALNIVGQKAKWKGDMASDKQLALLRKFRVPIPKTGMTKGQASMLLNKFFNNRNK